MRVIRRYGFQDPPKFDPNLNDGRGGLAHGNGRTEALEMMQAAGETPPKGIGVDETGIWYTPVLFGNDFPSQVVAKAYAIDHNNLTVIGGDLSALFATRMWDPHAYALLLEELEGVGQRPLTLTADETTILQQQVLDQQTLEGSRPLKPYDCTIGAYRFTPTAPEFEAWLDTVCLEVGSEDSDAITALIRQRLNIPFTDEELHDNGESPD
ncbi:MAG: hypothetical protein IAE79_05845 [Anaerolinea sp.]|nr:hypothetical protein [Anaerolinea sp.]